MTQEARPQAAQVGPGGLLHSKSQLFVIPDGEFTGGHSYLKGLDLPFADLLICILGTKPLAKSCGQGLNFLPFCKEEPLSTVSCTTQHRPFQDFKELCRYSWHINYQAGSTLHDQDIPVLNTKVGQLSMPLTWQPMQLLKLSHKLA